MSAPSSSPPPPPPPSSPPVSSPAAKRPRTKPVSSFSSSPSSFPPEAAAEISALKTRNASLEAENASLENKNASLEAEVKNLRAVLSFSSSSFPSSSSSSSSSSVASPAAKRPKIEPDSTIVVYDGSKTFREDAKVTGFTVAAGVTTIGDHAYFDCPNLASLGVMREGVRVIKNVAFARCPLLTSLQGLPKSLTTIADYAFRSTGLTSLDGLPSAVTAIGDWAFAYCYSLTSIGPGFSPDCDVHPLAFYSCPTLLVAAQAKGFSTAVEWGRRHWLSVNRRFPVLYAVRQVRRDDDGEGSPLLKKIALLCDDLVREVVEFVGACE